MNWYECCNGKDSTYEIRVGMAETPSGPFLDQVDGTTVETVYWVHSSPLVRSTFCPMEIDHKSGLTLYPGYWLV